MRGCNLTLASAQSSPYTHKMIWEPNHQATGLKHPSIWILESLSAQVPLTSNQRVYANQDNDLKPWTRFIRPYDTSSEWNYPQQVSGFLSSQLSINQPITPYQPWICLGSNWIDWQCTCCHMQQDTLPICTWVLGHEASIPGSWTLQLSTQAREYKQLGYLITLTWIYLPY